MAVVSACGGLSANADAQALAEEWLAETTETQRAILNDRVVSTEEYVRSLRSGAQCLAEAGFAVSELRDVPDGIRQDFMVGPGERQEDEITAEWDRCRAKHYAAVESVWLLQHARLDEGHEALQDELVECLEANGVAGATVDMADDEIWHLLNDSDAAMEAWVCRERFLIYTGQLGSRPGSR